MLAAPTPKLLPAIISAIRLRRIVLLVAFDPSVTFFVILFALIY
jgi:hypothetical protein